MNIIKILKATALMTISLSTFANTFGPVENFDVVNDTGITAHGFQVRLHGIHSSDITSIFGSASRWPDMERYGVPTVTEGNDTNGIYTDVVYQASYNGTWTAATPSGTLPVSPSDSCWPLGAAAYGPNYPCDHFGISTAIQASSVEYNWLLENGTPGQLKVAMSNVPAPVWAVTPQAVGGAVQAPAVAVVVRAPPIPQPVPKDFGEPKWVKVTATGYGYNVAVEDLVAENAAIKQAQKNVQVEWQLLQTDIGNPLAGQVDLSGVNPDPGYKSIIYRFEFYKYTGAFNSEYEALPINGNTATPAPTDLGIFLVAQNAAVNLDGQVPPIAVPLAPSINNTLPDGVAGVSYSQFISVTGVTGDTVNVTITGLPSGLSFNAVTNTLSGTPTQIGTFSIGVTATDITNNTTISATTPMQITDPAIIFAPTLPDAVAGNVYSSQLAATGGNAPFSYTLSSGTLPAGLSLNSNGLISGIATASSTTTLIFTATDNVGVQSQSVPISLVVLAKAAACSGNNSVISFVNKYWVDFAGGIPSGGQSVKYPNQASTTFAPGLTFGAFVAGQWVSYSGVLDAANMFCLADTMAVSSPLNVPTPTFASVQIGSIYPSTAITPSGGWSPYTIAINGLPNGLTFNGTVITGTPTVSGSFPIAISVTDSKANTFNITSGTIVITNPPINLGTITLPVTGTVGTTYSGKATASGGVGTLNWSATGLPSGVLMSSSGIISGTPNVAGVYTVVSTAKDSIGQKASVNNTITIGDFSITAASSSLTVKKGSSITNLFNITSLSGFNGSVTLAVSGMPTNVTTTFTTSSIANGTGSATLNIKTSSTAKSGSYVLMIKASSGALSHTTTVYLTVK